MLLRRRRRDQAPPGHLPFEQHIQLGVGVSRADVVDHYVTATGLANHLHCHREQLNRLGPLLVSRV